MMNSNPIIRIMLCLAVALISAALLTGCQVQPQNQPERPHRAIAGDTSLEPGTYEERDLSIDEDVRTLRFSGAEDLSDFIRENSGRASYGGYPYAMMKGMEMDSADRAVPMTMNTAAAGSGGAPESFSQTNNQVSGVDEADIIKTDGRYIYTISGSTLYIVKSYPAEDSEVISTVDLSDQRPEGIFIEGDRLAVFGSYYGSDWFDKAGFSPRYGVVFLNIYDVSDRKHPELVKEYKFEGSYLNARLLDGYAYIVVREQPAVRPVPMPYYWDGPARESIPADRIYYYNIPYRNPQLVSIHSLSLEDPDKGVSSTAVMVEGSQNMYMSRSNIYLTYTEYINEYELEQRIIMDLLEERITDSDRKLIRKIKETDNDVLTQYEKEQKIQNIYMSYLNLMDSEDRDDLVMKAEERLKQKIEEMKHFEYTLINRIRIDDGDITPAANGKVPGHIINQFSMDEDDGVFRIATTVSQRWSRFGMARTESGNNVYALDDDLRVIGKLEGLAKGESIYSTRFMGDRLYMVTFRQVDPFFVIDLSDPEDLKELGRLKIPGFSRYLHPYDKDTIIGLGQDSTATGRVAGLKISLFDVSDVSRPKEIAKFVTDEKYAQSTALYEHKAFLFDKDKEVLVIPAYSYDYSSSGEGYNGAFVFRITKDDITLRGLVDHSKAAQGRYGPAVERSLLIDDNLYTKSQKLIRINALSDLHSVKNVSLTKGPGKIVVY